MNHQIIFLPFRGKQNVNIRKLTLVLFGKHKRCMNDSTSPKSMSFLGLKIHAFF